MRLILLSACFLGIALAGNSNMQNVVKPFGKGNKYIYQYNAQISSGLIAQSDEDPQQKASTQIQAQVLLTFTSDRHAQLQLQQIRVGQLNEQLSQPEQVQPMSIFEPKQLSKKQQRQLEEPCQFSYADGVIDRVQFAETDSTWSKNIKRGVLNMIQLNLKRNNAQGLRQAQEEEFNNEEGQNTLNGQLSCRPFSPIFSNGTENCALPDPETPEKRTGLDSCVACIVIFKASLAYIKTNGQMVSTCICERVPRILQKWCSDAVYPVISKLKYTELDICKFMKYCE